MRTDTVILAGALLLWVSPLQLHSQVGEVFSGEVVGVTDGDTVRVMRDRTPVRVRLMVSTHQKLANLSFSGRNSSRQVSCSERWPVLR